MFSRSRQKRFFELKLGVDKFRRDWETRFSSVAISSHQDQGAHAHQNMCKEARSLSVSERSLLHVRNQFSRYRRKMIDSSKIAMKHVEDLSLDVSAYQEICVENRLPTFSSNSETNENGPQEKSARKANPKDAKESQHGANEAQGDGEVTADSALNMASDVGRDAVSLSISASQYDINKTGASLEDKELRWELSDQGAVTPAANLGARLYVPIGAQKQDAPLCIFFHGGGFVVGDLESHDLFIRRFAARSKIRVLSIAYRLAPDNPFPAALWDARSALHWLHDNAADLNIDPSRIAVAGDSAGGNLSARLAQEFSRDMVEKSTKKSPVIAYQLLIYPLMQWADYSDVKPLDILSGGFMSRGILNFCKQAYLCKTGDELDPQASPLLERQLQNLPRCHVITAGLDPLERDGKAYVSVLEASGNQVMHDHFAHYPHGFTQFGHIFPKANACVHNAADLMREHL